MWSMIQAAGWPIWPLIFASIVALALIFERLYSLRQSIVAPAGLVDRVLTEYRSHGPTAELLSKTARHGPLGRQSRRSPENERRHHLAFRPRFPRFLIVPPYCRS